MDKSGRRRSPQENKRLSYERDCVNSYGENDKAARKAVRRFKAASNRAGRRGANQAIQGLERAPEDVVHETALFEAEHLALKPRKTKVPATPLKDVVPCKTRETAKWAIALKPLFKELGSEGVISVPGLVRELGRRRVVAPHGKLWSEWLVREALSSLGVRHPPEWDGRLD